MGKQIWRDIRGALRSVGVQVVARVLAGLLALLGAVTAADPQSGVDLRNGVLLQDGEQVVPKR